MPPRASPFKRLKDRIMKLIRDRESNRLTDKQFFKEVKTGVQENPTAPVALPAGSLSVSDLEEIFNITRTHEVPSWTTPIPRIRFSSCFEQYFRRVDDLVYGTDNGTNPAITCLRLNMLLVEVSTLVKEYMGLPRGGLHLQLQSHSRWGPFQWRGVTHEINGSADYSLSYGPKEETCVNLCVIEAKTESSLPVGKAQLLTYLAMVRAHRISEGKEDLTVYGIVTDCAYFEFYELNQEGKWFKLVLHTSSASMQQIANVIAEFAIQTAIQSRAQSRQVSSVYYQPRSTRVSGSRFSDETVVDWMGDSHRK